MRLPIILSLLALCCLSACAWLDANHQTTEDGDFAYQYRGSSGPNLVLEAGLGDGQESWDQLRLRLAQNNRVFSYNRAGYGGSTSHNKTRDAKTLVNELRHLLQHTGVKPPYILIGHSLGGSYMEYFARNYPQEVAGLILVDSREQDFTHDCQAANARACTPPKALTLLLPAAAQRELQFIDLSMSELRQSPPLPAMPLAVLTGMRKIMEGDTFRQTWLTSQKRLAASSPIAQHWVCDSCGHYIHKDQPQLLLKAVEWIKAQ